MPDDLQLALKAARADPADQRAHLQVWACLAALNRLDEAIACLQGLLRARYRETQPVPPLPRKRIEGTTLCAIDCLHPELTVPALRASMAQCDFEAVKLLTDRAMSLPDIEVVRIGPIRGKSEYSHFMFRELLPFISTDYVLLAQWDGYVIDASRWDDAFLLFDYIGARWPASILGDNPRHDVGNGGFSLRSRALLQALGNEALAPDHPEDAMICRAYRDYLEREHGIAFASRDIADRFAHEHIEVDARPFGFHGVVNMSRHLGWAELGTFAFLRD